MQIGDRSNSPWANPRSATRGCDGTVTSVGGGRQEVHGARGRCRLGRRWSDPCGGELNPKQPKTQEQAVSREEIRDAQKGIKRESRPRLGHHIHRTSAAATYTKIPRSSPLDATLPANLGGCRRPRARRWGCGGGKAWSQLQSGTNIIRLATTDRHGQAGRQAFAHLCITLFKSLSYCSSSSSSSSKAS
ncbi:hypothetical protein GGTG_02283 [Gaeumannomyces tritici R3-111a-1]|uniref:Uncharacterized protein n=1 Tax=Gaeumannomyces tritici (strain R3-111a-1) TaxID=644352 RepID=J3NLX8_GAET3|nr:hypothetical protein GGTG_02283 [Gaeumannomyces tritici R3-111a-1]EJT82309.1 hypothetical protein GGTG_02283 [Gaeumannomyces tritici R3-111a-1]